MYSNQSAYEKGEIVQFQDNDLEDYVDGDSIQLQDFVSVDQLQNYVSDQLQDCVLVDQLQDFVSVDQLQNYVSDQLQDFVSVDQLQNYVSDQLQDCVLVDQLQDFVSVDQLQNYVSDQLQDFVSVNQVQNYVSDQLQDYVSVDQLQDYLSVNPPPPPPMPVGLHLHVGPNILPTDSSLGRKIYTMVPPDAKNVGEVKTYLARDVLVSPIPFQIFVGEYLVRDEEDVQIFSTLNGPCTLTAIPMRKKPLIRRKRRGEDGDLLPTAPPMEGLDRVIGYEDLSFDAVYFNPPEPCIGDFGSLDPEQQMLGTWAPCPEYSLRTMIPHSCQISETVARSALMGFVKSHCCWGVGAARNMSVTSIRQSCAYHYVLQTFTEKREARWAWAPHVGGDPDGPEQGGAPKPWDLPATPAKPFHSEVKIIEVPHTASVKPCHKCRGNGSLSCPNCHGKGFTRCLACQGDAEGWGLATENRERCIVCGSSSHGYGRQDCNRCGSKGRVACPVCDSYGQLKCFIQLTVTWKCNVGEYITGGDDVPHDLIRHAEGQIGIEETGIRVAPLPADIVSDETLSMASAQLVSEHLQISSDALLLAQRHQVRVVPITTLDYHYKSFEGTYYIYGVDNRVHAPEYPQKCCCGCTIL